MEWPYATSGTTSCQSKKLPYRIASTRISVRIAVMAGYFSDADHASHAQEKEAVAPAAISP